MEIASFGEWVQKRRNQLGFSRRVLAKQIGCAPITIKKIERDERRPSEEMAELFARHLQIPEESKDDFIRRARGEFVPRFGNPEEMSLAEAQSPTLENEAPIHNLPVQTTPFFGREQELADIAKNLADPSCRLLTILGAGGMGKTRLSIEAAAAQLENFTDGVTYVVLATINATENNINPLAGALADALNISFHGGAPPEQQLFDYLKRKEMLIVFDNFEHLVESAEFLSQLLVSASDLVILTTSRERLGLPEEWLLSLQGLSFSEESTAPTQEAVQLFQQRGKQVKAFFDLEKELPAVLQICRLVEGMPLGLELAAAWVQQLSCAEIVDEITAEFDFLTTRLRTAPNRHRSMRAVFNYSWQKLTKSEQVVLQKLSVFRGGFDRQAAKAITGASLYLLSGLVDKSLLSMGENGRYLIHELLRQFAEEQLKSAPQDHAEVYQEHGRYYLAFVADQAPRMEGRDVRDTILTISQNIDNVRAAIRWAVDHLPHLFDNTFGLTLMNFFEFKGWYLEGSTIFGWIDTKLKPYCDESAYTDACQHWAFIHYCLGFMQWRLGRLQTADEMYQQSLEKLPPSAPLARGVVLTGQGMAAAYKGEFAPAHRLFEESHQLLRLSQAQVAYATSLFCHDQTAQATGDYELAQRLAEESGRIFDDLGEQAYSSYVLSDLGRLATHRGEFEQAKEYLQASLIKCHSTGYSGAIPLVLGHLGDAARIQGDDEAAIDYYQQCIATALKMNLAESSKRGNWGLGELAVANGAYETALRYFQASGLREESRVGGSGWAALGSGDFENAANCFQRSLQAMLIHRAKPIGLDSLVGIAHLRAQNGQMEYSLELLALVQHHPASNWEIKEKARKLREELVAEFPPEVVAAAEARGRELDLIETAEALLNEGDLSSKGSNT